MKTIKKIFLIGVILILSIYFIKYITTINTNTTLSKEIPIIPDNEDENSAVSDKFIKAYVSRIVDGDTIEVIIDSNKYKVRFIGIDCPEYTSKIEYYGKESTEYTTSILNNTYVFLEKDVSETDKYGRLLRYVWLEVPKSNSNDEIKTKMFNAILVINGYASDVTYPPDIKYSLKFNSFAADARNSNMGLWNKE
jgi:micrococcal nuclease